MDALSSKICRMMIIVSTVALAGWFTAVGNPVPVIVLIGLGAGLFYLCKSGVKEIVKDERDERISEKASKIALKVFAVISAVAGIVLIAMRYEHPEFTATGFTLAFSACALMVLYSIVYGYYNKRYGYESLK